MGCSVVKMGIFYPPPKRILTRNMINIGYFQSEKYFYKFKSRLLEELTFNEDIVQSVKDMAEMISSSIEPTCLHIRLGDYVNNPLHGVLNASYYRRALSVLKEMNPKATIFVFSDSINNVMREIDFGKNVHYISDEINEMQTLYLGSLCKNFIISNSSFSWWMQYLSNKEDRLVIAPSRWYAKECPCDIYQDFWKILDV